MKNPSLWLSSGEGIHPMSWLSQDCSKTATWLPSPGTLKGHSGTVGQCGRKWRHWAWQVHTITPPQTSTSAEGVDLNCPLLLREWKFWQRSSEGWCSWIGEVFCTRLVHKDWTRGLLHLEHREEKVSRKMRNKRYSNKWTRQICRNEL